MAALRRPSLWLFVAGCSVSASFAFAQAPGSGGATPAAAPGGAVPSVAPGGAVPSAAPGGAIPSAAPGGAVPSAAPGGAVPSAAPGSGISTPAPATVPANPANGGHVGRGSAIRQGTPQNPAAQQNQVTQPGSNVVPNVGNTPTQRSTPGGFVPNTNTPAAAGTPAAGQAATSGASGGFRGTPTTLGVTFGTGGNGLQVGGVAASSIAQQGGLQVGDQILGVNGTNINSRGELQAAIQRAAQSGAPLNLAVRRNGQVATVGLSIPNAMGNALGGANAFRGFTSGLTFAAPTGPATADGMTVSGVEPSGWAADAGLQTSDRILSVNGRPVTNELQMAAQLQAAVNQNGFAELMVNRNGRMTPLRVNGPGMAGGATMNATTTPRLTGNFANDFGQWAGDYSNSLREAELNSQKQFQQLRQFNDRITRLRGLIQSSTGRSADNVRILEQLRALRTDMAAFGSQSGGFMQAELQSLNERLNQLQPDFAAAGTATAGTGPAQPTAGTGNAGTPTPQPISNPTPPTTPATPNTAGNPTTTPR